MFLKCCLKLGEKQQMWLTKLKIAIVQKDTKILNSLMENLPQFDKQKDTQSAIILLQEATSLIEELQSDIQTSMIQMKKNINFLQSTQAPTTGGFDITS